MAFNKKLRIGQIDLTDLSSSEIASAADIANVESNVTSFESTALANVDSIQDSVDSASTNIDTVQSNLTTFEGTIDTVQDNVTSETTIVDAYGTYANSTFATQTYVDNAVSGLVSSSPTALDTLNEIAAAMGDDADIDGTLRGKIDTVQDNVTTVISSLDTVQGNLDAFAATTNTSLTSGANTSITANGEALSNTTIFLAAGAGVSLSVNSTSKTVSVDSSVSNITSQVLSVDGTANSFTLPKSASNTSMMVVFYNGLALRPSEYGVSSTTLTINNTDPLISDSELEVRYFDFFDFPGSTTSSGGFSFQGSTYAYAYGGRTPSFVDTVDQVSLTSDADSTDIGESGTSGDFLNGGASSETHGYIVADTTTAVKKFAFTAATTSISVGSLTDSDASEGGSASSGDAVYYFGAHNSGATYNKLNKIPTASDTDATAQTQGAPAPSYHAAGNSSDSHGYSSGGYNPYHNTTMKFPFSSDTGFASVGTFSTARAWMHGSSSTTHGYILGGLHTPPDTQFNSIEKFTFSSDSNATDVGELTANRLSGGGSQSSTSGYSISGKSLGSYQNTIQKFPFASDTSASNIANLSQARSESAVTQY